MANAKEIPAEDVERIMTYLDLPSSSTPALPLPPLQFLNRYLPLLPYELLVPFASITNPRERASIRSVKSRRLLHATKDPIPAELTAERGRLRWPLLWERMGGSSLPPPTANVREEESWVEENFLPGRENVQHVKKLGGFLRSLEEEREMMDLVAARRAERRLDNVGEEFDEESDEEEEVPITEENMESGIGQADTIPLAHVIGDENVGADEEGNDTVEGEDNTEPPSEEELAKAADEQAGVRRAFERRLLELFVDGLDTLDYTAVDFTEPPEGDPTAERDQEDAYFDDQEASGASAGNTISSRRQAIDEVVDGGDGGDGGGMSNQNGQGEYDY